MMARQKNFIQNLVAVGLIRLWLLGLLARPSGSLGASISGGPIALMERPNQLGMSDELVLVSRRLASSHNVNSADYDPDEADIGPQLVAGNGPNLEESELNDLTNHVEEAILIQQQAGNGKPINGSDLPLTAPPTDTDQRAPHADTRPLHFGGSRKSHIIRWPSASAVPVKSCDTDGSATRLRCEDENAVCRMGGCVCKIGFFLNRQSGLCQSIVDLLKNCDNDHQCQAFNVDMICDTKSHVDRPICDCADGLYFDLETHTCLPCIRLPATAPVGAATSPPTTSGHSAEPEANNSSNHSAQGEQGSNNATSGSAPAAATVVGPDRVRFPQYGQQLGSQRACRPIDLLRLGQAATRHRRPQQVVGAAHDRPHYDQPGGVRGGGSAGAALPPTTTSTLSGPSSDPFRIRTPLEVFMGAIMLFTLFTVAWFFLQRMIHDCRAILRSLRDPDYASTTTTSGDHIERPSTFLASARWSPQAGGGGHFLATGQNANGQTVARLFSSGASDGGLSPSFAGLSPGLYQRDLAGVMVQHLAAANCLSPSSTNQALVAAAMAAAATGGASGPAQARLLASLGSGHDQQHDVAALYPYTLTSSAQQSRTAAAAAAAQLLLSPSHPAIAILRAAAAAQNSAGDYGVAPSNLLSSMFDPPPKYEEAIAQQHQQQQPPSSSPPPPPPPPPPVGDLSGGDAQANGSQPITASAPMPRELAQSREPEMSLNDGEQGEASVVVDGPPLQSASSSALRTRTPQRTEPDVGDIHSAVIGSTEAEFQNDFIQVFPMYQLAPMPDKNS